MIVVETSALIAILLDEPEAPRFRVAIEEADRRVLSAVSLLETGIVMRARQGPQAITALDDYLTRAMVEVAFFDRIQAGIAIAAFDRYGKGIDPAARLNFGDCASYALAKSLNAPLLFKGDDFTATDVRSAISSA